MNSRLRQRTAVRAGLPLLCVFLLLSADGFCQTSRKEIIGYFPSWKWRDRENLVNPSRIPYEKLTIINYAFFAPRPDGTITGVDSTGDRLYLSGMPGTTLVELAHTRGVKVLLSIGGWEESDNFPAVAASKVLRDAFVHSCMQTVLACDFDGLDIDWEFPGYAEHRGSAEDRENFTLLLQLLRDSLNSLGNTTGRRYLLTAALPAGMEHLKNIEAEKVAEILDQLNIMTYDFYGSWDPVANHNSPLYASAGADTSRCVDAAYRLYHERYGVPAEKINIGLPFYGKAYAGCTALNSPHTGADTTSFPGSGPFYHDLVEATGKFTRHWDDRAKVPYLIDTTSKVLVSYDDPESIRAKVGYVAEKGIHGVIIWEITGDFLPDGRTPLLDELNSTLETISRPVR